MQVKTQILDVKERTFIVKHFLKEEDQFWYTENLRMYSKSWTTINIKHIYSLLTNLCGQDVYLMWIKGRSKAARNYGNLSFMEEAFLVRPDKSMRRAQSERSISTSLVQRISKSLFESLSMQNSKLCGHYYWTTGLYEPLSC